MSSDVLQPPRTRARSAAGLVGFALAVTLVAGVGGAAAGSAAETYDALDRPFFAPPAWLFGPVWTVLYVMIALSGWLVWREVGWDRAMSVYAVQLVLNALWTPLFFAGDLYGVALLEISVLLVTIGATVALFRNRSKTAALLLLPYAAWVAFATALNAAIWALN